MTRGATPEFRWVTLDEILSHERSAEGITEVSKSQTATALKISTLTLTDKKIGMRIKDFEQTSRPLTEALSGRERHLRREVPLRYREDTIVSQEFADLVEFYKRLFPWQAGRYDVDIELQVAGVEGVTQTRFSFTLVGADRLLFSTDYPFEEISDAADWFDTTSISETDRIKIGRLNSMKLFKLGEA